MNVRRRSALVVLGLMVVLATVLGVACLCTHSPVMRPVAAASPVSDHNSDHPEARERACAVPGHDQCGDKTVVATPTTGPDPHPFPQVLPAYVDARPAATAAAVAAHPATPRAPDLHVLQVLRT